MIPTTVLRKRAVAGVPPLIYACGLFEEKPVAAHCEERAGSKHLASIDATQQRDNHNQTNH